MIYTLLAYGVSALLLGLALLHSWLDLRRQRRLAREKTGR